MRLKKEPEAGMITEGGTMAGYPRHILPERVDRVRWFMVPILLTAGISASSKALNEPPTPEKNPIYQAGQQI